MYYVYITTNKTHTVLYTGVTNDLRRRVWEHKQKLVGGFTKKYNVDKLVYYESFERVEDAIAAEKRIKGWVRSKKVNLIKKENPSFEELPLD